MVELLSITAASLLANAAPNEVTQAMKDTWAWIYLVGLVLFYILVLVVIPLGFRDLRQLFGELREQGPEASQRSDTAPPDHSSS